MRGPVCDPPAARRTRRAGCFAAAPCSSSGTQAIESSCTAAFRKSSGTREDPPLRTRTADRRADASAGPGARPGNGEGDEQAAIDLAELLTELEHVAVAQRPKDPLVPPTCFPSRRSSKLKGIHDRSENQSGRSRRAGVQRDDQVRLFGVQQLRPPGRAARGALLRAPREVHRRPGPPRARSRDDRRGDEGLGVAARPTAPRRLRLLSGRTGALLLGDEAIVPACASPAGRRSTRSPSVNPSGTGSRAARAELVEETQVASVARHLSRPQPVGSLSLAPLRR